MENAANGVVGHAALQHIIHNGDQVAQKGRNHREELEILFSQDPENDVGQVFVGLSPMSDEDVGSEEVDDTDDHHRKYAGNYADFRKDHGDYQGGWAQHGVGGAQDGLDGTVAADQFGLLYSLDSL